MKQMYKYMSKKNMFVLFIFIIIVSVFFFCFGIGRVTYDAMKPSYKENSFIVYNKLSSSYEVGDVVLIDYQGHYILRRVMAVSGSEVNIDNEEGKLYVNGHIYDEYGQGMTLTDPEGIKFPVSVSKKHVFVLSDQRDNVLDSRKIGCVSYSNIVGKVIFKI